MKPRSDQPHTEESHVQLIEEIISGSKHLGVDVSTAQATMMLKHLSLVLDENRRQNLTRIETPEEGVVAHIVDSLAASSWLSRVGRPLRVVDVGSGAGYPGIPLAILLGTPVTLVESTTKKAVFLEEACRELGLAPRMRVFAGRAEDLALEERDGFDAVVARAVAALPSLAELASPLLGIERVFVAMKGRPTDEELRAGVRAAEIVGMVEEERFHYTLPLIDHKRTIIVYRKVTEPTRPLPRRPGVAQKRPLA